MRILIGINNVFDGFALGNPVEDKTYLDPRVLKGRSSTANIRGAHDIVAQRIIFVDFVANQLAADLELDLSIVIHGLYMVKLFDPSGGTHLGECPAPWGSIPPTGKPVTFSAIHIFRIADGKMEALLALFRVNFVETMRPFVGTMFAPTADPILKEWIINDMPATPPQVAIGAGAGQNSYLPQLENALQALQAPITAILADFLPIDQAAAQQHRITVEVIAGTGHFPMLEKPEVFNHLLKKAVQEILNANQTLTGC